MSAQSLMFIFVIILIITFLSETERGTIISISFPRTWQDGTQDTIRVMGIKD